MTRIYESDTSQDQAQAKLTCRPLISAIRRASGDRFMCDKWITTGRCKVHDCRNTHPDWDPKWNGMWLHHNCGELATLAKVPVEWQPE